MRPLPVHKANFIDLAQVWIGDKPGRGFQRSTNTHGNDSLRVKFDPAQTEKVKFAFEESGRRAVIMITYEHGSIRKFDNRPHQVEGAGISEPAELG
jgi:hypothetical protein